jgi:fido (protein-threonine AMPylation protein)
MGCAPVVMNAIFNMHPFSDRNGRCGRVIFNLLCRAHESYPSFVPLYELAAMAKGEFVLRLRLAQYRNDWEPLIGYINTCASYLNGSVLKSQRA